MVSNPRKDNAHSRFEAKSPHFFKIILDSCIRQNKVRIPPSFVRRYGDNLSSPVTLKVPTGAKWKVEIVKIGQEIWLQNGWEKFVDYYSIATGSFLVFQFDQKNHVFTVIVFDKSATEIEYPFTINNGDDDEAPNNLQQNSQKPLPFYRPATQVRGKRCYNSEGMPGIFMKNNKKRKILRTTSTDFKHENPIFRVTIKQSSVYPGDKVAIPISFAMKYFNKNQNDDAILNLEDGSSWPVKCYIHISTRNRRMTAKITNGWKAFVEDNHLEIGDVCEFELIKATQTTTFRVTIFPHTKGENKQLIEKECGRKKPIKRQLPSSSFFPGEEAIEAAKKFTSMNPFFKVIMRSCHLTNGNVYIPGNFIMNIEKSLEEVKLQVENKCWAVKINVDSRYNKAVLSRGWVAFARENSLRLGDVCVLELVDKQTLHFNVTIFRNVIVIS